MRCIITDIHREAWCYRYYNKIVGNPGCLSAYDKNYIDGKEYYCGDFLFDNKKILLSNRHPDGSIYTYFVIVKQIQD